MLYVDCGLIWRLLRIIGFYFPNDDVALLCCCYKSNLQMSISLNLCLFRRLSTEVVGLSFSLVDLLSYCRVYNPLIKFSSAIH